MSVKGKRRRAPASLPVGSLMAMLLLVVAVVLVYGAYNQLARVDEKAGQVSARQARLDLRQADMDRQAVGLDQREAALDGQNADLEQAQKALELARADLEEAQSGLTSAQAELGEREQALEGDRADLEKARVELEARLRAFADRQVSYDQALLRAVDEALARRANIASALGQAFQSAGLAWTVDENGDVYAPRWTTFLTPRALAPSPGQAQLDRMLPVWLEALPAGDIKAVTVEVESRLSGEDGMNLAGRRALAILAYARESAALGGENPRAAVAKGAVRPARAVGRARAVFRFHLDMGALEQARAG